MAAMPEYHSPRGAPAHHVNGTDDAFQWEQTRRALETVEMWLPALVERKRQMSCWEADDEGLKTGMCTPESYFFREVAPCTPESYFFPEPFYVFLMLVAQPAEDNTAYGFNDMWNWTA